MNNIHSYERLMNNINKINENNHSLSSVIINIMNKLGKGNAWIK